MSLIYSFFSPGISIRGVRSLIWFPVRSSRSRFLHTDRAEMSVIPRLLRFSSVTSDLKVTPPRVMSAAESGSLSL